MTFLTIPLAPTQLGGVAGTDLGQLLVVLVALAVVVLVGRTVLKVAWRLVTIAVLIVAALYVLSLVVPGLVF